MKKVFLCRVVKYENNSIVEKGEISMVFASEKKAQAYCNWHNKENDASSVNWMSYILMPIQTLDYEKLPW